MPRPASRAPWPQGTRGPGVRPDRRPQRLGGAPGESRGRADCSWFAYGLTAAATMRRMGDNGNAPGSRGTCRAGRNRCRRLHRADRGGIAPPRGARGRAASARSGDGVRICHPDQRGAPASRSTSVTLIPVPDKQRPSAWSVPCAAASESATPRPADRDHSRLVLGFGLEFGALADIEQCELDEGGGGHAGCLRQLLGRRPRLPSAEESEARRDMRWTWSHLKQLKKATARHPVAPA